MLSITRMIMFLFRKKIRFPRNCKANSVEAERKFCTVIFWLIKSGAMLSLYYYGNYTNKIKNTLCKWTIKYECLQLWSQFFYAKWNSQFLEWWIHLGRIARHVLFWRSSPDHLLFRLLPSTWALIRLTNDNFTEDQLNLGTEVVRNKFRTLNEAFDQSSEGDSKFIFMVINRISW